MISYKKGFLDGIRAYAWWKDGRQEVGTTGRLLSTAIEKVEETWSYDPPPERFYVREASGRWYPDAMPLGEIVISRTEDPESSTGESFKITANLGTIVEGAGTYGSIHEARRGAEKLLAYLSEREDP